MSPANITHVRRLVCSMVTELAHITNHLDLVEELRRLPSEEDAVALAESAEAAQDATVQLSTTAEEIFPMLAASKFTTARPAKA